MKLVTLKKYLIATAALCLLAPAAWADQPAAALVTATASTVSAAAAPESAGNYRLVRSAQTRPGKFTDALRYAKEVNAYINRKYAPVTVRAYAENFGDVGAIHWSLDFSDLASIERFNAQLFADKDYWALVNKSAAELFVEGSVQDTLLSAF